MLIVPVIRLLDDVAVDHLDRPLSATDCSFSEPVKMARLWRVQNAKVLHVIDNRSNESTSEPQFESVRKIVECLDIPIQLESGFTSATIASLLNTSNASRVVSRFVVRIDDARIDDVPFDDNVDSTANNNSIEFLRESIDLHGSSKVCALICYPSGPHAEHELHQRIEEISSAGCGRIVLRDSEHDHTLLGHNISLLSSTAESFKRIRFSATGGIDSYATLQKLNEAAPANVDSLIIDRALYENRFPCQQFWCWHEKDSVDLEKFSSATDEK